MQDTETVLFSWWDNTTMMNMRKRWWCAVASSEKQSCSLREAAHAAKALATAWEWRRKQLWLNWGMTILRSDTTSFGLLVSCIPQLPAGKIPPRDPKIHDRPGLSSARPASREVGQQAGRGEREREEGPGGRAASLDKPASQLYRPQMTVTTQQEC